MMRRTLFKHTTSLVSKLSLPTLLANQFNFGKYVYNFEEGNAGMKYLLGGKGSNLCEMTNMNIPVPPGFILSVDACNQYQEDGGSLNKGIVKEYMKHLKTLEKKMGKKLGNSKDPLLVSVRSGAAISMPGMMDTVLNLGMNDKSVEGIGRLTDNPRFAWDSYRRFIQMFGDVVMGIEPKYFETELDKIKEEKGVEHDTDLHSADLQNVVVAFKGVIQEQVGT